jgi:hypothetical protein
VVDGTGNWSITLGTALADGTHNLTAEATDVAGNISAASSPPLSLTIDTTPPAAPTNLALDPSTDSGTTGDNLTNFTRPKITGQAEAGSIVRLFDGSTGLSPMTLADGSGNWSITLGTALTDGAHTLTATATDVAGNHSQLSDALTVTIATTVPGAPTNVALDPSTDSGTPGDNVTNVTRPTITGQAGAGNTVTLREGSTVLGTAAATAGGTWSISVSPALADGIHNLTATATDAVGNTSSASTALSLTILTVVQPPANLALVPGGDIHTPTITGTAAANSTVQVFDGSVPLGTTQANATGAWSYAVPTRADGQHTFFAVATDNAGNVSARSVPLADLIQTPLPPSPLPGGSVSPTGVPSVSVQLGKLPKKVRRRMLLTVTLTNTGTVPITGSLRFVLLQLNAKIKVVGAAVSGSPRVTVNPGGSFAPGAQLTFSVEVFNPRLKKLFFVPQVLSDNGVIG